MTGVACALRTQIIQLIDSEGNILNTFDSQTACAKFLNTSQSVVGYAQTDCGKIVPLHLRINCVI